MDNKTLKQIISQIKKYGLVDVFKTTDNFENWISSLNTKQIDNFLNLNIEPKEVANFKSILINNDLLNCQDYSKKVEAISKLKNGEGCWHLFDAICSPNFLKSKNFYKDIEMLSKANTARYGLWILGEDIFINSPYHDEDLKLLVETHDTREEDPLDFVVSDAIATVAGNIDSINSPHHRADMKLIATAGSDCLQMSHSYPEHSLNNLAVNKISLADKYHLENMQILATNPIASEFLYIIMTDPNFVKGKNYRKEVEALANAKSKATARALYYYIVNPKRKYLSDMDFLRDCKYDIEAAHISDRNSVSGSNDPNYLKNLIKINEIDDELVMHFVSLLMNPNFINSPYKDFDLELLQSISSKPIFMDLYSLIYKGLDMVDNLHHKSDVMLLIKTLDSKIRKWLIKRMKNENNNNYDYDIEYITKLKLDSISDEIKEEMKYYLFEEKGINDPKHREKLESLLNGIMVERQESLLEYLNKLEEELDTKKDISQLGEPLPVTSVEEPVSNKKTKSRVLILFKKDKR